MIKLDQHLRAHFQLTASETAEICSYFKPEHLKKKEYFLFAGSRCRKIAFIQEGVMRNYEINPDGNEVVKYMTSDGDFNTVYKYFNSQEPCKEYIQAVTDCELVVIDRRDFFQLKDNSNKFRDFVDKLVIDGLACKEERLKSYLTQDAQRRYENLSDRQPKIIQYAPLQYIASYLGITRETLSRIRNRRTVRA